MKEGWKRKGGREGGRRKVSCEVSRPFREHKSLPYKVNNLNRHIKEKLPDRTGKRFWSVWSGPLLGSALVAFRCSGELTRTLV